MAFAFRVCSGGDLTFERIEELLPFIEPEDFAGDETLSLICEALGVEIAAKPPKQRKVSSVVLRSFDYYCSRNFIP